MVVIYVGRFAFMFGIEALKSSLWDFIWAKIVLLNKSLRISE